MKYYPENVALPIYHKTKPMTEEEIMMSAWISVKDRLPGECLMVLAHFAKGKITTAWVSPTNHRFVFEHLYGPATHWMPLPAPPPYAIVPPEEGEDHGA